VKGVYIQHNYIAPACNSCVFSTVSLHCVKSGTYSAQWADQYAYCCR